MEHKQVFRKMNLDKDPSALGPDEYTYLKNGVPVHNIDGHDWSIGHVLGNTEIVNADLPAGTNTVIGKCEQIVRDRVFYFLHNSNGDHTIYVVNSNLTFQRVMRANLLNFQLGTFIDSDIVDDILIWTDNANEIRSINVAKAIAGGTYTPTSDEINLIKRPPQLVLTAATVADGTFLGNFIKDNYFQFYYQYVYENGEESVFSHLSAFVRPSKEPEPGYDHNAIDVGIPVDEFIPATVKQINYGVRINGSNEIFVYRTDFPVASTLPSLFHKFYNSQFLYSVSENDALTWYHSVPIKCQSLRIFRNRLFTINSTEGYTYPATPIENFVITADTVAGFGRTHKSRGAYTYGLMFFDNYGRHAGVHYGGELSFGDRDYNDVMLRKVAIFDLSSVPQAAIPTWATHYMIVRTAVNNFSFFLQHKTADILIARKDVDGTYVFESSGSKSHFAIDISGLLGLGIGYVFEKGDRIRLWEPTNNPIADPSQTIDMEIDFQDGRYVFLKLPVGFDLDGNNLGPPVPNAVELWNYEIYRLKNATVELFYETANKYPIDNPGSSGRAFSVLTGTVDGDCEMWNRRTFVWGDDISDGANTYDRSNPLTTGRLYNSVDDSIVIPGLQTVNFEMMNAFDKNASNWLLKSPGRSQIFNQNGSLELVRYNVIRYSLFYNNSSQISLLNVFEELNEYTDIPVENGPGIKLQDADNVLMVICQNESTALYIGEAFVNTADGNQFLAKTDRVIGDDRKYFGGHGTLHPESVEEYGGRVYFYDMTKGVVIRRSNDGLTPISGYGVTNFIRKFSRDNYANRSTMRFPGGYDPFHELYLLTAIDSGGTVLWTIAFHEPTNAWVGFFDYLPQFFSKLNSYLASFKDGKFWLHNNSAAYMNFYGVQKQREHEFAVAVRGWMVAVWHGLSIDGDEFHVDSGSNDIVVEITNDGPGVITGGTGGQYSHITHNELVRREGIWRSAIFRDINTPQSYTPSIRAKFEGNPMRGQIIRVKFIANKTNSVSRIRSVGILYRISRKT